jgi:hypothetical protein
MKNMKYPFPILKKNGFTYILNFHIDLLKKKIF